MFRVDDPRSEQHVLHELTQYKMAEDAEAILLFVLSTKTTAERFLLKLCQQNGNKKRIALPGLFLAESSSEEDEKVSASEEEAVTETERADENVESSYSDDSSADEAKRRKSAGKPKPPPSSSTVTKSSKKAPKKSNKRNKSLSEEEVSADSFRFNIQECSRSLYAFIAFRPTCFAWRLVMRNLHETSTQRAR